MPRKTEPLPPVEATGGSEQVGPPVDGSRYEVKHLALSDHMPIQFEGITYDLANLSDEQLAYLRQFPDQVPYLA